MRTAEITDPIRSGMVVCELILEEGFRVAADRGLITVGGQAR
jgi:hypothetical protein